MLEEGVSVCKPLVAYNPTPSPKLRTLKKGNNKLGINGQLYPTFNGNISNVEFYEQILLHINIFMFLKIS